jgi:branched-chain amino acid transport system permease protein
MFYRENGQFKTSYRRTSRYFPIAQDRYAIWLLLAVAFGGAHAGQRLLLTAPS